MTVQLALYKGEGQIGNAFIRWWTSSVYSHCELVVDGVCYSSSVMDKGVRAKNIDLYDGKWDIIELPWVSPLAVLDHFQRTQDDAYGWPSLIGSQLVNRNHATDHASFCSEWCAKAMGLPCPSIFSPASLGKFAAWTTNRLCLA